jgi:hypothetical protein
VGTAQLGFATILGWIVYYQDLLESPLMGSSSPSDRVERVLAAPEPRAAVLELAQDLRDGGMPQAELLALFDAARERHAQDADEARYDAILDAMDLMVGWCAPSQNLYPDPDQVG